MQNFRHIIRSCFDQFTLISGLLQWHERQMRRGLTILMYHRVLPIEQCVDYPLPNLVMPLDAFRQQMSWLAKHCQVLPVSKALERLDDANILDKPLVSVTFDDGYEDNYSLAAPVMEAFGLHGTFYVTSGFVSYGQPLWFDRAAAAWQHVLKDQAERLLSLLYRSPNHNNPGSDWMEGLKKVAPDVRQKVVALAEKMAGQPIENTNYCPMSPEQISVLHKRGHEIGSHTVSHPILPQLGDDALAEELQQSAVQLSYWTDGEITGFCYPNGDYSGRVERAVSQAGYSYACTTREGFNRPGVNPVQLQRLPMTMRRTMRDLRYEPLGFRAELCRVRTLLRL